MAGHIAHMPALPQA